MNNESVIAIVRIVLPCIISVLGVLGITTVCGVELSTINVEQICTVLAVLIGGFLSVWSGWKNNNVTPEAQKAQRLLDELKSGDQ